MKNKFRPIPAHVAGIAILTIAAIVFFIQPAAAAVIAFLYIVLCVAASFFPATNFFGSVISRGGTGENLVALTFDDGPAEPTTRHILDLLDKYSMPATFFVTGSNAARHPVLIREIIARGHTIGNHSFHHDPFLMLKSSAKIFREISSAQDTLQKTGVQTIAFRPPVGIVNPKLMQILEKMQLKCITFSCRAADAGNRRVKDISRKILEKVKADDIILLHDVPPQRQEDQKILIAEIESLLAGLAGKGLAVAPLAVLIGMEVNKTRLKRTPRFLPRQ